MLQFYGYKNCDTCRKAEKTLSGLGVEYEFSDITLSPPSARQLAFTLKATGSEIKKILNTNGVLYRKMNMKEKAARLTEKEILSLLSRHGKLIKRPIVLGKTAATIGFQEKDFISTWKK